MAMPRGPITDPSEKVDPRLRWHLHLVSSYKCEDKGDVFGFTHEQIKDLLLEAAAEKKTTERPCAWSWQKLDVPRDRTSLIIWQSEKLPAANNPQQDIVIPLDRFPSDGYAWADQEETTREQLGDYTIEIHKHRSGYVAQLAAGPKGPRIHGAEPYTVHARLRYRILPATPPKDGQSLCDPNIWLVLYKRAERNDVLRVDLDAVQQIAQSQAQVLELRDNLFGRIPSSNHTISRFDRGLDIKQKGFVWANTDSWPEIVPPMEKPQEKFGPGYNYLARGNSGMYLAGQHLIDSRTGAPYPKRARNNAGQQTRPSYILPEGEDDGGRDIMDVLTPREISVQRYKQHTEWMEELFVTPYPVHKLKPVSLGQGRAGYLSTLSKDYDFIDTSIRPDDERELVKPTADQYNAYIKQAEDKISEMQAEMEKEKALHEKRMAKIRQSGALQEAERKLRSAVQFPPHATSKADRADPGHAPAGKDVDVAMVRQIDDIKNIAQDVEASLGRRIEVITQAQCINKGGLEEKAPTPVVQQDTVMEGTDDSNQRSTSHGPANGFQGLDGAVAEGAPQAQPDDSLALPDDDFEMVDKDDILGDASLDLGADDVGLQNMPATGSVSADPGVGESGTPGDDFSAQFLDLPDDSLGGTPADDFGTSAFDDAFDGAGAGDGDAGNPLDSTTQPE